MTIRAGLFDSVDAAGVNTFGESLTITFHDSGPVVGDCVWSAPGERIELVDGFQVASTLPSIGIHLSDWPRKPEKGDTVTRAAVVYEVREVTPDGQGGAEIELARPRPAAA